MSLRADKHRQLNFTTGYVTDNPGYPEEILVECIAPDNYNESWVYEIWNTGKWDSKENITRCFDPGVCYDPPPDLALDYSNARNVSIGVDIPNELNTTITYTCTRQCKTEQIQNGHLLI